jgi:DNA invertase Pin-like site-specific DNA recombinase
MIGERTRDGLAEKRAAGVRLGRPRELPDDVRKRITRDREAGKTLREIAERLNAEEVPTAHKGKAWYPSSVRAVLNAKR